MSRHRDLVCLPSRTIQNDDDLYESSDDLVQGRMKLTLWRDSVGKGEKDWEKEKRKIERQLLFQDLNVFFPCFLHWFLTIFGIMWIWRDLKNHACGVHHPWPPYHRCLFISLFFSQGAKIPSNKTSAIERCWLCCDFHQQQQNPPISAHKERWRNPGSYFSTKGLGAFLLLLAARLGWLVKVWGSNCGIHEPNSWNHMFPFIPRIPNQILLLMLSAPNTEILGSIS